VPRIAFDPPEAFAIQSDGKLSVATTVPESAPAQFDG
jgi:hypothetical protein